MSFLRRLQYDFIVFWDGFISQILTKYHKSVVKNKKYDIIVIWKTVVIEN